MNQKILFEIARWALRVFLVILGFGVLLTGWGMCQTPGSAEMGGLLLISGVLLPGAEGVFHLLKLLEKKGS